MAARHAPTEGPARRPGLTLRHPHPSACGRHPPLRGGFIGAAIVDRLPAGENGIKVWREHRGLTISELAAAAGLSQPYVSQIESGARKGGRKALAALTKALGVEAGDLAAGRG